MSRGSIRKTLTPAAARGERVGEAFKPGIVGLAMILFADRAFGCVVRLPGRLDAARFQERSGFLLVGQRRRPQPGAIGPAITIFDDAGTARPSRRGRLSLLGQLARQLEVPGHDTLQARNMRLSRPALKI